MFAFIGKVIGVIFAFILLRLSYRMFEKGKGPTAGFVAALSVVVLLSCFSWFQGWAKSIMTSNILSRLESIGQQVNTVQETTSLMLNDLSNQVSVVKQTNGLMIVELSNHQTEIDKHQKELEKVQGRIFEQENDITNQFHTISIVTSNLNAVGTDLDAQSKKLSDVEYWVHNIFDNTTNEVISATDTNNMYIYHASDNTLHVLVRLDHAPIVNSSEVYVKDSSSSFEQRLEPLGETNPSNMLCFPAYGYNPKDISVSVRYVIDARKTNLVSYLPSYNISFSPDYKYYYLKTINNIGRGISDNK